MRWFTVLSLVAVVLLVGCKGDSIAPKTEVAQSMEIGCAKCIYKKAGVDSCEAAAKIDGNVVMLEGPDADPGKLMAAGFCATPIQAKVAGKMEGDKFVASSLKVVPVETPK